MIKQTLTTFALCAAIFGGGLLAGEKPNILVIVTDDQGYADLSAYPHAAKDVKTPHMDRIAKQGVTFTQAYAASPVCSPAIWAGLSSSTWVTVLLPSVEKPL